MTALQTLCNDETQKIFLFCIRQASGRPGKWNPNLLLKFNFENFFSDGPNVAYQNTNHDDIYWQLSFGHGNFGDDIVRHQYLERNIPYTIRMSQVKEPIGYYVFFIEVDGDIIFEEINLSASLSSSTSVYFSNNSDTSLGNDAKVDDVMIFNGRKDGNYHGMWRILIL